MEAAGGVELPALVPKLSMLVAPMVIGLELPTLIGLLVKSTLLGSLSQILMLQSSAEVLACPPGGAVSSADPFG